MFCINSTQKDVWFNLAAEEYLLKQGTANYFMLWQSHPAVVVGKHQDVCREVDLAYTATHGIQVARRYTGGGAVYHDGGNLNLTFIETTRQADFNKYTGWIMDALAPFGLPLRTDTRRSIYIGNRKVSGSAQCIWKDRVLYHATLLYASDLPALEASLRPQPVQATVDREAPKRIYVGSVKSPVTNIRDHLPRPISMESFREYLADYFLHRERGHAVYSLSKTDSEQVDLLMEQKYRQPAWNYNSLSDNRIERVKTI